MDTGKTFIEADANKMLERCKNRIEFIKQERIKGVLEAKERSIKCFRKKLFNKIFRANILKENDEVLFEWMLANCRKFDGDYGNNNLFDYQHKKPRIGINTMNFCHNMIRFIENTSVNNKICITLNDFCEINAFN